MNLPKPKPRIEFKVERPEQWPEDTFGIRIYYDGEPGPWVHWVDRPARRVVTSEGIHSEDGSVTPCGWNGSKSQATTGAEQLQKLYDLGEIQ